MKQKWAVSLLGAASLALCTSSAFAAGPPDALTGKCSDTIQNETIKVISAIQKQIKTSLKNNRTQPTPKDSLCSGGLACAGGNGANGKACTGNASCTTLNAKLDPTAVSECTVNGAKGIAGAINAAKGGLRKNLGLKCTDAQLITLGFPSSRCPDPAGSPAGLQVSELADCILDGVIGDIPNAIFGDPAGEVMGRGAGQLIPDSPSPNKVCGVTLGSLLHIASESASVDPAEAGGAAPLKLTCVGQACDTEGSNLIGNSLTSPTSSPANLCLKTSTVDAGNGTTQDGTLNLGTGAQVSNAPISTEVYGGKCPKCDSATKKCLRNSLLDPVSLNEGKKCTNSGATDIACPPSGTPIATVPNPLNLSTGTTTITIPISGPGVNNPSGTFCGACNGDPTKGCQNDAACGGDAPCDFGSNTGAFGVDAATEVKAIGHIGPVMPRLAGAFCTGSADNGGLIDTAQGLPGPVRLVQQQLNAYEY